MSVSALAKESSEFRCAECGYGICLSGALPPCPMCQAITWEPSTYTTRGAEMRRTTEPRKDEGVAAKRAQTELTASVGSRLVPQTSGWKRLFGGRRKAPTAGA
jgi:hypothetical protein